MGYGHNTNDSTLGQEQEMDYAPVAAPGTYTPLWSLGPPSQGPPQYGNWDMHCSAVNADPADSNVVLYSSFPNSGSPTLEVPTQAWNNELLGIATDGSGKVYRFGRHYNTTSTSAIFSANQAIPSISQDGKWMGFTSDWDCELGSTSGGATGTTSPYNCRADVFMLQLK